jgi:hypothetical protein
VEIYPVRSKCPVENIELAFEGYGSKIKHPVQTITDPDGNNIILLD